MYKAECGVFRRWMEKEGKGNLKDGKEEEDLN